jgi:hypothetical protein
LSEVGKIVESAHWSEVMTRILTVVVLIGFSPWLAAEIFRCDIDGVIVFSDAACQPGARPYQAQTGISIISQPADQALTRERNQQFIKERLDRQAAARLARVQRAQTSRTQSLPPAANQRGKANPPGLLLVPYQIPNQPVHRRGHRHGPPPDSPGQDQQQRRYSALSGPFPGTRRRGDRN